MRNNIFVIGFVHQLVNFNLATVYSTVCVLCTIYIYMCVCVCVCVVQCPQQYNCTVVVLLLDGILRSNHVYIATHVLYTDELFLWQPYFLYDVHCCIISFRRILGMYCLYTMQLLLCVWDTCIYHPCIIKVSFLMVANESIRQQQDIK